MDHHPPIHEAPHPLKGHLKSLFDNVFWPAAAGNVFWSLFTLLIDSLASGFDGKVVGRMVVLVLLTFYLSIEWVRNKEDGPRFPSFAFFIADALHIWAVVFIALTAQTNPTYTSTALYLYFIVNTLGHASGVWRFAGDSERSHVWLALVNLTGVAALLVGYTLQMPDSYLLPASLLIVVVLWLFLGRRDQFQRLFSSSRPLP